MVIRQLKRAIPNPVKARIKEALGIPPAPSMQPLQDPEVPNQGVSETPKPEAPRPSKMVRQKIERVTVPNDLEITEHVFDEDLQRLAEAAKQFKPRKSWGRVYEVVSESFDHLFYYSQNPKVARERLDPVAHYLLIGAKSGCDPTPWFSTIEYRRRYQTSGPGSPVADLSKMANPFFHYLNTGQEKGFGPRAPSNYARVANSMGLTPQDMGERVRTRIESVRERLLHGELGEMVLKANELDPLVGQSLPAALRVRVPPASNAIGVRRIGHLMDLQEQAENRRAQVVLVAQGSGLRRNGKLFDRMLKQLLAQYPADEIVLIITEGVGPDLDPELGIRVIDFVASVPKARDYRPGRTLIEYTRSLRPEVVVNFNSDVCWRALNIFGKAISASSSVHQCFLIEDGQYSEQEFAAVMADFYRAIDLHLKPVVADEAVKARLGMHFSLTEDHLDAIMVIAEPDDATQEEAPAAATEEPADE